MSFQLFSALLDVVLCESPGYTNGGGYWILDFKQLLLLLRHSMFADITVIAVEKSCGLMCWRNWSVLD